MLSITFIKHMKYWKFKSGRFFQFIVLTDSGQLLFGNYSETKIDEFIYSIHKLRLVPSDLKGVKIDYIKSVIKGAFNKSISIILNSGSEENIRFNDAKERDSVFNELKIRLREFNSTELDLSSYYKKQFIYNCIRISILGLFIWMISDSIVAKYGYGSYTIIGAVLGGLIKILLILTGKFGIIGICSALLIYQIFILNQHLKKDSKIVKLRRK